MVTRTSCRRASKDHVVEQLRWRSRKRSLTPAARSRRTGRRLIACSAGARTRSQMMPLQGIISVRRVECCPCRSSRWRDRASARVEGGCLGDRKPPGMCTEDPNSLLVRRGHLNPIARRYTYHPPRVRKAQHFLGTTFLGYPALLREVIKKAGFTTKLLSRSGLYRRGAVAQVSLCVQY